MKMTDATADPLLRVNRLSVRIGLVDVVQDISFSVGAGEIVGIVGESGSGKSITCRSILRLLPANASVSGGIDFDGRNIAALSSDEMRLLRGRQISMIFQNPASHLDPLMTVGRHVAEPLRLHLGHGAARSRAEAIQLLRDVRIRQPELRVDSYPHELSGGMKQRAMIASAIACSPRLLLADEPSTALDVTVQAQILELLKSLNERLGLAIVLVSHDLGVISEICDRVVVMRNGGIVETGTTHDIIHSPQNAYTKLLISSRPGGQAQEWSRASGHGAHETAPILELRDLSVRFASERGFLGQLLGRKNSDALPAVDNVCLSVNDGESLGIVGESGSGKSTVARVITRLLQPSAGDIHYRGKSILNLKGDALTSYHRCVQMVFQNPFDSLNPRMTVTQAVAEPLVRHRLCGRQQARKQALELLELVDFPMDLANRRPRQLSGGQCQRVGIARSLALEPEILIADEITSALDVTIQAEILALLADLRRSRGLTVVYISHDLSVVRGFCDRVAVFQSGRLVEMGDAEEVLTEPGEDYTQMLVNSIPKLGAARNREVRRHVSHGSQAKRG